MTTKAGVNPVVEFFFDVSCPFAYIASTRIESLASRCGATLVWRPVLLGAIYRATAAPQGAAGSASDVFNFTKKTVTSRSFDRTIQRYGIEYKPPPRHPMKTTAALRLLYFIEESSRPALSKALFRAYWVEGASIDDPQTLISAVKASGISDRDTILDAIRNGSFEGDQQRRSLETATNIAVERGTPGVPGFWVADEVWLDRQGQKRRGRLYWGQDRMHFVEAAVLALRQGYSGGDSIHKISQPLQSLMPRCARGGISPGQEVKLEFWFDFSSPWAFTGWTQLARLQRQFGKRLQIEMRPFLLGILFRQIGAPNEPGAAVSKQKAAYNNLDLSDWIRWWNAVNIQTGGLDKNIDFCYAHKFPIRTPEVLRAALVEPSLTETLYRACWERDLDVANSNVLKNIIREAGYNADQILEQANGTVYKEKLRQCTKEAIDTGLCGVPTYRVFRRGIGQSDEHWALTGDLVWGQDEVNVVEDLIAGWRGSDIAQVERGGQSGQSRL